MADDKQKRKQILAEYKKQKTYIGVFQLKNTENGKIFIGTARNLYNKEFTLRMQLDDGRHMNPMLQKDYRELGGSAFEYSVLEEKVNEDIPDLNFELKMLEKKWLTALEPFGDKGYNKPVE